MSNTNLFSTARGVPPNSNSVRNPCSRVWVMRRVVKPAPAAANPPVVVPAPKMSSCPVVVVTAPLFAELLMPDADAPTSKGLYRMARAGSEANLDRGPHDPRQDIEPRQPLPARLFVQAAWVVLVKVKPNIQRDRATLGLGRMGHAGCDLQGGQLKRGGRPTYQGSAFARRLLLSRRFATGRDA